MKRILLPTLSLLFLAACSKAPAREAPVRPAFSETRSASTSAGEYTPVVSGQVISLPFVEITVGEPYHSTRLSEGYCVITPMKENTQYYWLHVTLKNTSDKTFPLRGTTLVSRLVFDGQEVFPGHVRCFYASQMLPQTEYGIYIFAAVPTALLSSYETVAIQFAFNDGFSHESYDAMDTLAHRYQFIGRRLAD